MEWEYCYSWGEHSVNLMLSSSYIGAGVAVTNGDFSVIISINLLIFHITIFIDKGRWDERGIAE